jgi:hypothetical protein
MGVPLRGIEIYQIKDPGYSEPITQLVVRDLTSLAKLNQGVLSLNMTVAKEKEEAKKMGISLSEYHAVLSKRDAERMQEEWNEEDTKVTLEQHIKHLEDHFELERERQKKFASIAFPLFNDLWIANVRGPQQLIKAFGVSQEVYDELKKAAGEGDTNYGEYARGKEVEFQMYYKSVPIVIEDKAVGREVIPIYSYGRLPTTKAR